MNKISKISIIFWFAFLVLTLIMGATRHVYMNGPKINGTSKNIVSFLSSFISNTYNLTSLNRPLVIPNTFNLNDKFNYSKEIRLNNDYLLVSSWDNDLKQCTVKLISIYDDRLIYKWTPDINIILEKFNESAHFESKSTTARMILRHPLLLCDGSLIFGTGNIFKIDKNSKILWSKNYECSHTIERDFDGNIWICSVNSTTKNSNKYEIRDCSIKKISSQDGKIIFEKSVFEILMENGYGRGNLFISPIISTNRKLLDYIHINDVQPILSDSKFWKKGDLFLSIRNQNLVLLYRPSSNKIIWHQNGPWLKQHNVDIIDSCRIGIFGNNVLDAQFPNERDRLIDGHNTEYIYDFSTNKVSTPYDEFFKSANIGTFTEGRSRILPNEEIFVEESNNGRIIYGNKKKEIWSYIEKIGDNKLSMLNWCRYITAEEFTKLSFLNKNN